MWGEFILVVHPEGIILMYEGKVLLRVAAMLIQIHFVLVQ